LAFDRTSLRSGGDVWVRDLARGSEVRLTEAPSDDSAPVWTTDDDGLYFHMTPDLYYAQANGVGAVELVLESEESKVPVDLTADGRALLWISEETGVLSALDLETRTSKPLLDDAEDARLSPDGAWLVVEVRATAGRIVAVQAHPGGEHFTRISSGAGTAPRWTPAGDEILFESEGEIVALHVELHPGAAPVPGKPRVVVPRAGPNQYILGHGFEITPDGKRLLLIRALATNARALTVLENALTE
jgi:Tol biopolymer transport system component